MTNFTPPAAHEIKAWPKYFFQMVMEHKKFELRKNDRNYKVGDILYIREWNPDNQQYTGNALHAVIKYVLTGTDAFGLPWGEGGYILREDFCILSFEVMHKEYSVDAINPQ